MTAPAADYSISSITGDRNRHIDSEDSVSEDSVSIFPGTIHPTGSPNVGSCMMTKQSESLPAT